MVRVPMVVAIPCGGSQTYQPCSGKFMLIYVREKR